VNTLPASRRTDCTVLRAGLLAVTETLRDVEATAWSRDGLIEASVGGRGELTELRLDGRIFRDTDSVALAGDILDAVHRAAASAAEQVAGLTTAAIERAGGRRP
jgi:DNA-binding protein YbaB